MQCGKKKKKRERGREGSFILILHCNRPTKILVVQLWVVSIFFSWPVFYITLWWTCVSLWKHNYSENIGFNNSRNNKVILQVKTYIINTRKTPTPNTSIRLTPQPPWPPKPASPQPPPLLTPLILIPPAAASYHQYPHPHRQQWCYWFARFQKAPGWYHISRGWRNTIQALQEFRRGQGDWLMHVKRKPLSFWCP